MGQFGAFTLTASTKAIESTSPGDATFTTVDGALRQLEVARDALAGKIKAEPEAAAFDNAPIHAAAAQIHACQGLIRSAQQLAAAS